MTITAAVYGEQFNQILARVDALLASEALRGSPIRATLDKDLAEFRQRGFLTIAFVGEYSAGKSSLISALTGRRDLAISADIATDACKHYEWNGVQLVDTPGLWTERTDHDARTYEAIARADLLVYCLTYSLFDTTTLANFKDLAFERNYQNKMLLLVNKMSCEGGDVETRIGHYTTSLRASLAPYELARFPLAFCDARDQLDGIDEDDPELMALSRFDTLTAMLNEFIAAKGATARLDTPLRLVLASLDEITEASARDDGRDDQQMHLLKKLTGVLARQRRALSVKVEGEIAQLTQRIEKLGHQLGAGVGVSSTLEADLERAPQQIEAFCLQASDVLHKEIEAAVAALREEMGKEFASPLMADFLDNVDTGVSASAPKTSNLTGGLKSNVATMKRVADTVGLGASKTLIGAAEASKTGLATGIRTVGKWAGIKFKPWQAANWAKNLSNAVPYLNVAMSLFSLVSNVASEVEEAANEAKLREAKRDLLNNFANIASDVGGEIRQSAAQAMQEIYGQADTLLAEMKTAHERDLGATNAVVGEVAALRAECGRLLQLI
ncbi:MAG: GTPase [Gammaproteobacteria bacterium]